MRARSVGLMRTIKDILVSAITVLNICLQLILNYTKHIYLVIKCFEN